ncbi:MAG: riboflavin biosynthesis protein RibD [Ectothiorhodospiraceae bacterium]|nr:riboflavin biosynthesis protein RibD [Ectothiorhodospiraceae bacterium]
MRGPGRGRGREMVSMHDAYMERAIELALRGGKYVRPNPMVGAVLVKNGRIIGEGWHRKYGGAHAEVEAIRDAGADARDATLYVTLEPCNHHGKTPPCTGAIIEAGISEVVIGTPDPNPDVVGGGMARLERQGIRATVGILGDRCAKLLQVFTVNSLENRPFIQLKLAQTLDGCIALSDGSSKWITGAPARQRVHEMRAFTDAILVGAGTVRTDDPMLNVRDADGESPRRIVISNSLDIPSSSNILTDEDAGSTIIVYPESLSDDNPDRIERLKNSAASLMGIAAPPKTGEFLHTALESLFKIGIYHIMVEGGSATLSSFVQAGLFDRIDCFIAPKIFGGGLRSFKAAEALFGLGENWLSFEEPEMIGEDILLTLYPKQGN